MSQLLKTDYNILIILLSMTVASFVFLESVEADWVMSLIAVIAAVKALLVIYFFMEVNRAPYLAMLVIGGWVIILSVLIINMQSIADMLIMIKP